MTIGEAATVALIGAVGPSIVSGLVLMWARGAAAQRQSMGERMGAVEKWQDREDGRKEGYAEGYEAARRAFRGSNEG